jgi:hypothetical protein
MLVRYDTMCRAIDAAHKVDEVKDIRDKAVALEHYARQAQNTDAERHAAEIRLRAERKAGQLLGKIEKANGGRPSKTHSPEEQVSKGTVLEELGISRKQSAEWEKLGAMTQRDFDLAIGESVKPPSTKGILRASAPPPRLRVADPEALWLWGRLLDFERNGMLGREPAAVLESMTEEMLDDTHRLAPKVAAWLKRIGATR